MTVDRARDNAVGLGDDLVAMSHAIHANPELGWEEYEASARCAEMLSGAGFDVTEAPAGLDTAFVATAGFRATAHRILCRVRLPPGHWSCVWAQHDRGDVRWSWSCLA